MIGMPRPIKNHLPRMSETGLIQEFVMPIISIQNNLRIALSCSAVCLSFLFTPRVNADYLIHIRTLDDTRIQIPSVTNAKIHSISPRLTPKIRQLIKKADDYFFVGHQGFNEKDQLLLVLVIQTPSRQNRSAGACGAGFEDTAYILKYNKRTNYLDPTDSLLIQSCLNSFSINNDSGSTFRRVLDKNINKNGFTVDWLNHPKFGTSGKTIVIKHGKFTIN